MNDAVVITGIGMVTPLGNEPGRVLERIEARESAATKIVEFDARSFSCSRSARVPDFRPEDYVSEAKLVRLMSREAQFAVAAARLAMLDAGVTVARNDLSVPMPDQPHRFQPEAIALFGATGLAGLPLSEVTPLLRASVNDHGEFDPARFGQLGLKAVHPLLSFKILSNMPLCFVSVCENIRGPNAIYTPWEGQGAHALEAGLRSLASGKVSCALAGACDVKTHALAFVALEQLGVFGSGKGQGTLVPGEGAVFLLLERRADAMARGARIYARLAECSLYSRRTGESRATAMAQALANIAATKIWSAIVSAASGEPSVERDEAAELAHLGFASDKMIKPKQYAGDLFAAAAFLQVALAALLARRRRGCVLANCFGHGSEQAVFVLAPS
jgi:3-oxoacyl-(acyl-carrier-protein) synthase